MLGLGLKVKVASTTSRASVMMQPMTAQTRSVPSMSSFRKEDLSWSMGTNQAPMAGVAVLSRFSCLQTQHRDLFSTGKSF